MHLTIRWGLIALLVLNVSGLPSALALASQSPEPIDTVRLLVKSDTAIVSAVDTDLIQTEVQGLDDWHVVEVLATDAEAVEASLADDPDVSYVAEVKQYQAALIPNDPSFPEQAALQNDTQPLADINAPAAWEHTTGSADTVIAIVDSGVDLTHEDLADKIWVNSDEVAGNSIDDDGNGYIDDVHGWDFVTNQPARLAGNHGTHIAGIAAARGNNGVGIAGVDWQARIMSVRVLNGMLGNEEAIAQGIVYAAANGADVINLSLVGPVSEMIGAAVAEAYRAGAVVVAAAGNNRLDTGVTPQYPVCATVDGVDAVLGVAATRTNGEPWYQSNYGACVNIAAPGAQIYSTKADDTYGTMSGTSMSAPFVSGVVGLYRAQHPDATPADIIEAFQTNAPFTGADADTNNARYKGKLDAALLIMADTVTLLGDTNTDGIVDLADLVNVRNNFGGTDPGDTNDDSLVDLADLVNVRNNFGTRVELLPADNGQSGGDTSGGGGDSPAGGGGGSGSDGGGGGDEPQPEPAKKPTVAGATHAKANLALLTQLDATFRSVFGKKPNTVEKSYWSNRVKKADKRTLDALRGAMLWQKHVGRTYDPAASANRRTAKVAGAKTANLTVAVPTIFKEVYGRSASVSELTYWQGRAKTDKKSADSLGGAIQWHRLQRLTH